MERARISQILLATLLASAAAGAAPAAETRGGAAPVAFSGVYAVTFMVSAGSALAPGAVILCKAKAAPHAPSLNGLRWQAIPLAGGVATASAPLTASATGGTWANCSVEIPFYWVASDAPGGALLSYEIDAVSGPGAAAVPVLRQEAIGVAYPAPGGTARLSIDLRF